MDNRTDRARIAEETLHILKTGEYIRPVGRSVDITAALGRAVEGTRLYEPADMQAVRERAVREVQGRTFDTGFETRNETTLAAARRLVAHYGPDHTAALNFASAKNPGGGFLGGSQAQEESLARATGLYACLDRQPKYYEANRAETSPLYTDHLILSPRVPVFRDDADELVDKPWEMTVITSPAPNAGAIAKNTPESLDQVEPTFRRRIEQILSVAVVHRQTALVLGAWGCGVYGNDPATVAQLFAEQLLGGGMFARAFQHVTFAVLDRAGTTIEPFARTFGTATS